MSVTPRDFLESAKQIDIDGPEIGRRNAISRAYYAAMHEAAQILPPHPADPDFRGSSHENLISGLRAFSRQVAPGRTDGAIIAGELAAMKGTRKIADYRLNDSVPTETVKLCLIRADKIFAACARIQSVRRKS